MSYDPAKRVPYFFFKDREHGIDAEASEREGYDVPKYVTFIYITSHGARDSSEWIAEEFIARKKTEMKAGRYDPSWVKEFEDGYKLYKDGREIPRTGTPTLTWKQIPESRREVLAPIFPTLEDLAATPDSELSKIGLDGRVLRDKARNELQAAKDISPLIRENAEIKEENARMKEQLEELTRRFDAMDKPKRAYTKQSTDGS